jgi:tetratricopeptide (TPR) repeat protein
VRAQLAADVDHIAFRVRFIPRVGWTPYREFRLWRHDPAIRFEGAIHETMVGAIESVATQRGLQIGVLDELTIEHFGYEGDQAHKHARNEPMLRAALESRPDRPFFYDHLARIYEDLGEHQKARATWRAGIENARARKTEHPDDRLLWINLLMHAVVREDPDGDLGAMLVEAQARWPDNPGIEFATATRELVTGHNVDAAERLQRLLAMDLDDIVAAGTSFDGRMFGEWAWNALGLARLDQGDATGAAEAFRRAEDAAPDNPAYRTRRLLAEARVRDS